MANGQSNDASDESNVSAVHAIHTYYQNVNGLRSKTNAFRQSTQISPYKLFVLTETGLVDSINSNEIFDNSFIVYRCDRSGLSSDKTRKGGVLIAAHSSIDSCLHLSGYDVGVEQIWIKIRLNKSRCIYIGVSYIVPKDANNDAELIKYQRHMDVTRRALDSVKENDMCYLFGDFNLPNITWVRDDESGAFMLPLNVRLDYESCVIDDLYSLDMLQVNDVCNDQGRLLDLVFTNAYENATIHESSVPLLPNERFHKSLELSVDVKLNRKQTERHTSFSFDFRHTNYEAFTQFIMQTDWQSLLTDRPVDEMVRIFYKHIERGLNEHAPIVRCNGKSAHPNWMTKSVVNLMHRQKKAHSNYMASDKSPRAYDDFSRIRLLAKQTASEAHSTYTRKIESDLRVKPKQFFNYVNEKRNSKGMPSTVKWKEKEASNDI